MTRNTDKWTVLRAKNIFGKLTKVANDMLDIAEAPQPTSPEEAAGTAGPQEVVDAIEVIVQELEQVQEAIPAEPTNGQDPALEPESPTTEPVAEPTEEPPVPPEEEDPRLAKITKELRVAQGELAKIALEKLAVKYGELHDESKVQQAKYDEVLASKEKPSYWEAKIEAIEQFKVNEGTTSYKPAQTTTSWLKPRSRVAQVDSGMRSL